VLQQKDIHNSQTLEETEIDLALLQRELDAEGIAITREELSECKSMGQLAALVCAKADEQSSIMDNV